MPRIFFEKFDHHLLVDHGANLMESLLKNHIPVASSCGGDGVCKKCEVRITDGVENLSAPTPEESDLSENVRLSCQVSVRGDVKVDTDYW